MLRNSQTINQADNLRAYNNCRSVEKTMSSRFVNTNKRQLTTIILITIFFTNEAFSYSKSPYILPNKTGYFLWTCEQGVCNTYLKLNNKTKETVSERSSLPSIQKLNSNLTSLFFSCGSPCNYTKYYDIKKGLSSSFEFTVAIEPQNKIVLLAKGNKLIAVKIFDPTSPPLFTITRDWSPTVALYNNIIEAKFSDDTLYIKYLEGKNFTEKEETIHGLHGSI